MQRLGFEASNQLIFNLNVKWRWGPWAWGWADVGPEGESSEDHHVAQSELSSYRGGQPFIHFYYIFYTILRKSHYLQK